MKNTPTSSINNKDLTCIGWEDYELIDSGNFRKIERFGNHRIVRNEPAAGWKPALPLTDWDQADAFFNIQSGQSQGSWQQNENLSSEWTIRYKELSINLFISRSRHIGIFPEQHQQWDWITTKIEQSTQQPSVLNLFGYTGVATLAATKAGAIVTHVDASKNAITHAKKNFQLSGFSERPIRWIVDDAYKFVQREIRRGNRYDAIILDPPNFGRGPDGEVWKFDKAISILLSSCTQILKETPLFLITTAYNVDHQASELGRWVHHAMNSFSGKTSCGDLIQQEISAGRKIHQAIYSIWERGG